MAPMNDPEILVYLALDNPKGVIQYGGTIAEVKEALASFILYNNAFVFGL